MVCFHDVGNNLPRTVLTPRIASSQYRIHLLLTYHNTPSHYYSRSYYHLQPYVPAYDTVADGTSRIPAWIQETVYTRNTVNVRAQCVDYVRAVQSKLVQYKNAPEEFITGELLDRD